MYDHDSHRLWYSTPARECAIIEEGLPIGNGRLGGLVGAGPGETVTCLTDASMWSGVRNEALDASGQFPYTRDGFGTFQMLCRTRITLAGHDSDSVSGYERALDISNGVLVTTYSIGGATFRHESFISHPHDVVVTRITQTGGGRLTGSVELEPTRGEKVDTVDREDRIEMVDDLGNGLRFAVTAGVATQHGEVVAAGEAVRFTEATEVVVVVSGGTNYRPAPEIAFRDPDLDISRVARAKLVHALREPGSRLLATHVRDYRTSYDTFSLDLGASTAEQRELDTASRLAARGEEGAIDPEFDVLYLQLARYLTITGSRDGLPANLQGLWLETNAPDWMSDYHSDINIQMNYWPTHRFGLGKHATPLLEYCLAQLPDWTRQTNEHFNDHRNRFRNSSGRIAGWTTAFSTNIYGGNGWWWHPGSSAWLCLELWQHYEFTLDRRFLERLMPLLRGAVEFWETRLIEKEVGEGEDARTVLVGDKSWSPEHGPQDAIGLTYEQELVHALFGSFAEASRLLDTDHELAGRAREIRDSLYLPAVSPKTGWLQEWMTPDSMGDPQHRHLSGLIGLYPGDRIRTDNQPQAYLDGVRKQLEVRGYDNYGWANAWRAACWARLKDSHRAYRCLSSILRPAEGHLGGSGINLFDLYRTSRYIFQIDANFGAAAAMLEMLVQAKSGVIDLMPAVPAAWKDGSVSGMGVRGGFVLDMTWRDGAPTVVRLLSVGGTRTEVRVGDWHRTVNLRQGDVVTLRPTGTASPPPPPSGG
ncbi:glycoside hydrolase N-terminal domain-containing protein [Isoptericola hypogeus]|uniref:Glycoside hydrolase N-terminal domain-containing protein n=1 Tax=Isoptericola hypogeus TaxID=300179 RepID=A0ABP4VK98_9MICO